MRETCLLLFAALFLSAALVFAFEVESAAVGGDDRNEGATYSFIRLAEKRIILPNRTSVKGSLHNSEKSLWVLNYHETSDYDGVDLICEEKNDVYTVGNLWSQIADDVRNSGMIKTLRLARVRLEVTGITGRRLACKLSAQTADTNEFIERSFFVDCDVVEHRIAFSVVKK